MKTQFQIIVFIVSLLTLVAATQRGYASSKDWNLASGEGIFHDGQHDGRIAWVEEELGRGGTLVLYRCRGNFIQLVDLPQDGFWDSKLIDLGSINLAFLRFYDDYQSTSFSDFPIITAPGMDGDYFDLDAFGTVSYYFKSKYMALCPSNVVPLSDCRRFSLKNFEEAINFVCKTK